MITALNEIQQYLFSLLNSSDWPAFTVESIGEQSTGNYILIESPVEFEQGTADQFLVEGNINVSIISKQEGVNFSRANINNKVNEVLLALKPTPQSRPNANFFVWEVAKVGGAQTFSGSSQIFIEICTINYKYQKT